MNQNILKIYEMIDDSKNDYAIFDCDNTIIMHDLQATLNLYMLENNLFKFSPENLKIDILEKSHLDLKTINELYKNYSKIYKNDKFKEEDSYKWMLVNFREILLDIFYNSNSDVFEYLYRGYTREELKEISLKCFFEKSEIKEKIKVYEYNGKKYSYKEGLSLINEMYDIIKYMNDKNLDVYIISGSVDILVKTYFNDFIEKYYNKKLNIKKIYGMKLEEKNLKFTGNIRNIKTIKEGKVEIIEKYIKPLYEKNPIFVAGDSIGDYDMLTKYEDMKYGLIVDRNRGGLIKELIDSKKDNILIQYVDEYKGIFIDGQESITLKK